MRRSSKWSVSAPVKHGRRWRIQFSRGSGREREVRYEAFDTRAAADAAFEGARDEATGTTVRQAVDMFLAEKRAAGLADATILAYGDRLKLLLGPVLNRPLRVVLTKASELYAATFVRSNGAPRAADTHQHGLIVGRIWAKWCVRRKLLKANPFAEVDPVGRKVLGADKPRLTVDESRRLEAWCLAHAGDQRAVLTLGYLYLGARASELVKRTVRDLDDEGRLLWIGATKTASGRRRLRVPEELRGPLLALAGDRSADAWLFANDTGARWSRYAARRAVRAVLELAGVSVLSPQALRRTQATLATEAGETALAVARHLGHATGAAPAVTGRSYVGREAARAAAIERGIVVLQGGRK